MEARPIDGALPDATLAGMKDNKFDLREGEPAPLPEEPKTYPIHPLFPLPEGQKEDKEIYYISFDRWDHKGVKERCPDRLLAAEIQSFGQIIDMFGGGTYQFISFDSKGNFARWSSGHDKLHSSLPCKPLRQQERAQVYEEPPPPQAPAPPPPQQPQQNDMIALVMQQMMASQERAERAAQASSDKFDRLVTALVERATTPAPSLDPMTMLTAVATIFDKMRPSQMIDPVAQMTAVATLFDKMRPAQTFDPINQLSGMATIVEKLSGRGGSTESEESALQPIMSMLTQAMNQGNSEPRERPREPERERERPRRPALPPDMVWVEVPNGGPALMRREHASRLLATFAAQPASPPVAPQAAPAPPPVAPQAAPAPARESWESIAERLADPNEQAAFRAILEEAFPIRFKRTSSFAGTTIGAFSAHRARSRPHAMKTRPRGRSKRFPLRHSKSSFRTTRSERRCRPISSPH